MTEISKPSNLDVIWASAGDILNPGDTKYSTGWAVEIPPRQWENYIQNKQDQAIAHFNQHGVSVWDNVSQYIASKSYVQGPTTGAIYRAKVDNVAQNPELDTTHIYWDIAFASPVDFYSKTAADAAFLKKANNLSDLTNTNAARTNLNVYSKAETYNKTEVDAKTTVASTAQAQALISNTVLLTPQRLADAFKGSNQSLGASGFQKLPGGFILQWGVSDTVTGNGDTFSFPLAFPTACFGVFAIESSAGGWNTPSLAPTLYGTKTLSATQYQVSGVRFISGTPQYEANNSFFWWAIGN